MSRDERLYLDHNASAPLLAEARAALIDSLDAANASSVHSEGRAARKLVEGARDELARLVGCEAEQIAFTSGASEAATTCLSPRWLVDGQETRFSRLAVIDTDHPCVRDGGAFAPADVTRLPVDADGIVDCAALAAWADALEDGMTGLLVLTLANSETGVLQPLDEIQAAIAGRPVRLVLDVVQMIGRIDFDFAASGADAAFVSGHKFGAAKGVGAMMFRDPATRPFALVRGGGQEKGRRAGTEAVPAIASLGAAACVARQRLEHAPDDLMALRRHLETALLAQVPQATLLGGHAPRLPNTVAIAASGLRAETAQIGLDLAGLAVSAGSACSSGKVGRSHVVDAMVRGGLQISADDGAIRISFGYDTATHDLDRFVREYAALAGRAAPAARAHRAA